jgi:hypothetical protein
MASAPAPEVADRLKIYTQFDEFLKTAIYEYYRGSGKRYKGRFIALLIASGEIASVAIDAVRAEGNAKRLALGAAGVIALRIGLRYALSGPLGILLAAGAAASLIGYFIRNRGEITGRIGPYRELVAALKTDYEQIQSDHRDGRLSSDQRSLMVDGLMKRFLADLDR